MPATGLRRHYSLPSKVATVLLTYPTAIYLYLILKSLFSCRWPYDQSPLQFIWPDNDDLLGLCATHCRIFADLMQSRGTWNQSKYVSMVWAFYAKKRS